MLLDEGWWDTVKGAVTDPKAAYQAARKGVNTFRKDWGGFWDRAEQARKDARKPPQYEPLGLAPVRGKKAKSIAVVYGPKLPATGYYMTGQTMEEVLNKLDKGLDPYLHSVGTEADFTAKELGEAEPPPIPKSKPKRKPTVRRHELQYNLAAMVNSWVINGYQVWLRTEAGVIYYFGERLRDIDKKLAEMMGVTGTTVIRWIRRANIKSAKPFDHYQGITGVDVNVPMSDEEQELDQQKRDNYAIKQAIRRNKGLSFDSDAFRGISSRAKQVIRDLPDETTTGGTP